MAILENALRERIRKKELYIVVMLAALILILCGSGAATITVDGRPVTEFKNMFGYMHVIVNLAVCILSVVLSLKTIPNEYERKTSHLVWIRGISQSSYHSQLAAANILSGIFAGFVLYFALAVYAISQKELSCLSRMAPAFLILCMNITIVSLLVSVLSLKLPAFAAGLIGTLYVILGVIHGILDIYKNVIGGFSGSMIEALLWLVPDLNGIQKQAADLVLAKDIEIHQLFVGLLTIYILSLGLFLLKRKEA